MKNLRIQNLALLLLTLTLVPACTKSRAPQFADGVQETIYPKSLVENAKVTVAADGQGEVIGRSQSLRASGEAALIPVHALDAPAELAPMFTDLMLLAQPGAAYTVRFQINKRFITAYKVVKEASELTTLESQIAIPSEEDGLPKLWVPIFQYKIDAYGIVVRKLNDLNEETDELRLKDAEWAQATHIQASILASQRLAVSVPAAQRDDSQRVFLKTRIDGSMLSAKEIGDLLNVGLASDPAAEFLLQVSGKDLNFFQIADASSSQLSEAEKEIVRQLDNGASGDGTITRCPAAIQAKAAEIVRKENCVLVQRYNLKLRFVVAERVQVDAGIASADINYKEPLNPSDTRLAYIPLNPQLSEVNPLDMIAVLDPSKAIEVAQVKGQEFFFRRTLEDSPNGFDYTFAGTSGELVIVKFAFDRNRVKILRADSLVPTGGSSNVDKEILLSVPAHYVKKVSVDENGQPLAKPRFIAALESDPAAIAIVDWTSNSVPNVLSPLNYYGLEQCFTGANERTVSNVDQRLANGVLSLSLDTSYASIPSLDCTGIASMGDFDPIQTNFTFRERFSFLRYVKQNNEAPLMSIPYEQQKMLGFGLFTYNKKVPDHFGNVGVDGTEVPLPAVFDLKNERQITYVLAGLPESGEERERVIQATKEVVRDWNIAFQRAFQGTPLEGRPDALRLEIEGVDAKPQKLGDLDRNYIYYIQKRTNSPVIGLGGAHANPRTGEVEAASVFVYGGNIWTAVDSIRRADAARKAYNALLGETLAAATPNGIAETGGGAENGARIASGGGASAVAKAMATMPKAYSSLALVAGMKNPNFGLALLKPTLKLLDANRVAKTKDYVETLQRLGGGSKPTLELLQSLGTNRNALSFYQAVREATDQGKLADAGTMEVLVNQAILDTQGSSLTENARKKLKAQTNRARAVSRLMQNMRAQNICAYEADESLITGAEVKEGQTDMDLLIALFKPTLAHELGHNLGLRHNFQASFDKENHRFDAKEETKRDYSSIMDYLTDDHETYDGLGPQDISAIRAAYAGLIEVAPEIAAAGKTEVNGVPITGGRFINLNDYPKALGLSSWLQLNPRTQAALPLKRYLFCSDEDAGMFPSCNRFDKGTTPAEIVRNVVQDHRELYSIRNFPNDRLRFSYLGRGAYIGRLFSKIVPIRQFLEETIYQAINGASGDAINANAQGAFETMQFLHEIIRSPDAPAELGDGERFAVTGDENGKPVVVERKFLSDISFDDTTDRLQVRGVEFDKVVALLMLTERNLGFPRYERVNLRFSFPEFERLLFGSQITSPLQLPTVGLLAELLQNRVAPTAPSGAGALQLDPTFHTETTETIRFYSILGAIANLDVDGLEATDNNSALYRVLSGFTVPKKTTFVMKPGVPVSNQSELRYWAFDGADVSAGMVEKEAKFAVFNANKAKIAPVVQAWVNAKLGIQPETPPAPPARELASTEPAVDPAATAEADPDKNLVEALKVLPDGLGSKDPKALAGMLKQVLSLAIEAEQGGEAAIPRDQFLTLITNVAKDSPIFALVVKAIPAEQLKLPILEGAVSANMQDVQELTLFSNTQALNSFFYQLHPEYRR